MKGALQLYHGSIKVAVRVSLGGYGVPQGPMCSLHSCHATHLYTLPCYKSFSLFFSFKQCTKATEERKLCCNILKHKSCYWPVQDSILFSWHLGQIPRRLHLCAACSVFLSGFWMIPSHLQVHLQAQIVQANITFVWPVTQPACTIASWHIWLLLWNPPFPKLWHSISLFFLNPFKGDYKLNLDSKVWK